MLKLLLVEDCPLDAELIEKQIHGEGIIFQLTLVQSKGEFHAAVDRERWDLVLTDFALPSFDALDVLTFVRSRDRDVPVILVTGTMPEKFGVEFIKKGGADFLLKASLTRLGSSIRAALEKSRSEKALRKSRTQVKILTVQLRSLRREADSRIAREINEGLEPKLTAIKRELSIVAEEIRANSKPPICQRDSRNDGRPLEQILSARELAVMKLLTDGKSLKEIAAELALNDKTISTYRARILGKLGLRSNGELIHYAFERQIPH